MPIIRANSLYQAKLRAKDYGYKITSGRLAKSKLFKQPKNIRKWGIKIYIFDRK